VAMSAKNVRRVENDDIIKFPSWLRVNSHASL